MNPFEMVVAIIFIVTIGSVIRAKHAGRRREGRDLVDTGGADNRALRDEVRNLKERIAVLERLATEDSEAKRLDREIEKLRDGR